MRNGISLLMIAKNEERVIGGSLKSFRPYVDEMLVADTGSKDNTIVMAKQAGAECVSIPWEDDFSKAKNRLIQFASYKWILFADADEVLKKSSAHLLHDLKGLTGTAAYLIRFEDFTDEGNFRTYCLPRLFLNIPEIRYRNCVHETITASLDKLFNSRGMDVKKTGVTFIHTGYLDSEIERKGTLKRNLSLLEKAHLKNPDDIFILLKYGDNLRLMNRDREALDLFYRALYLTESRNENNGLILEVCSSLTTLLIKKGDLKEARNILNKCPESRKNISLLYNLGILLWKKGEIKEALDRYVKAETLLLSGVEDPHGLLPFILNGIGEMRMKESRLDISESYFKRARSAAPGLLQPVFNLMRLSLERADLETAKHYLCQCELIAPDNKTVTEAKRAITSNAKKEADSHC